jgi:hypothetical protein
MKAKIGSIANYATALVFLTFGVIYLFKNNFMPYHGAALSLEWSQLEENTQSLILALMRAASGGFLASAVAITVLQIKFRDDKLSWIPLLILITGFIVTCTTLYATILVRIYTPGKPPTILGIGVIVLLIVGYILNRKTLKN